MAEKIEMPELQAIPKEMRKALLAIVLHSIAEMLGECCLCHQTELLLDVGKDGAKICRECAFGHPEETRANLLISLEKAQIPAESRDEILSRFDTTLIQYQKEQATSKLQPTPQFSAEELRHMN